MKILYIFDSDDTDRRDAGLVLTEWAKEHGHELVMRRAAELKPCLGCFGCWIRTPGTCVIPGDEGMSFVESMYRVDLVILAGETPYGSFSVPIKTILDRAIPLLLPFSASSGARCTMFPGTPDCRECSRCLLIMQTNAKMRHTWM